MCVYTDACTDVRMTESQAHTHTRQRHINTYQEQIQRRFNVSFFAAHNAAGMRCQVFFTPSFRLYARTFQKHAAIACYFFRQTKDLWKSITGNVALKI